MKKIVCYKCPYWRGHILEAMGGWCDKLLQVTAYDDWCYVDDPEEKEVIR